MQAGLHNYADESVLASGHWVQIEVSESGVCRMGFDELRKAGLDPTQLRVFGYGGEQLASDFSLRKIDDLPQVPVYMGEDYVLFWVQGPIAWQWNGSRFVHTRNTYSNVGRYFLTDNTGTMLTTVIATALTGTSADVRTYTDLQVHELDSLNLVDRSGQSGGGKNFYGEQFSNGSQRSFRFSTPNAIVGSPNSIYVDIAAYANSSGQSQFTTKLNSTVSKTTSISATSDHYTFGVVGSCSLNGKNDTLKQTVEMTFKNSTYASALGWLNYIELATPCSLKMHGDWMTILSIEGIGSSTLRKYHMSNATSEIEIWDITSRDSIYRVPTTLEGSELQWLGSNSDAPHVYAAVRTNGSAFVKATIVGNVENQNLHALKNIDYVIICAEGYEDQATRLAEAHEQKQSITWAVVTDKQVYNEFSSGTPDATAYRWLMKMLYDRADANNAKPRWLLLMGHGTFDNRKILNNSGEAVLLTYQANNSVNEVKAYATDDYFGWLEDNEGITDIGATMEIGVGRLPVNTVSEATKVVDKLINYMSNTEHGKWKNQLVYLADDGDRGDHTKTAEGSAERVRTNNPDFVVHKIYLDAYPQETNASGESYPLAQNRVLNLLKQGAFFFDYSGHGGYNAVTSESVLTMKDIDNMNNSKQGFWLFATCNFAQYDGGRKCAAETAVMNENGGAIGILAATRTVYADQNTRLNRAVTDALFAHDENNVYAATLGEAIRDGKNTLKNDENKLPYVLLGDPALRLNYPTDYRIQTTTEMDTLNALAVQTVQGRVIDEDSATVNGFNGQLDITIYDKMQVITTRDNDDTTGEPEEIPYNDYPNTIFNGSTEIANGEFEFTFMIPKDIRYNYGNGRIVYYAHDDTNNEDAVGHFEDFIVGGTGSVVAVDTVGPQMTIYLNTTAFQDGDRTYPTPRFFAQLSDENGINTAGAGIGHDLMLVVDNDPKQTYTLNEYFVSANNSYQAGQVSYLMPAMTDGQHSLTFRAWDLMNNSTTKSLNFIVESGLDPSIYSVMTYPNPVQQSGIMNLIVNYDQPDELLQTEIYLHNINGQMIYSHTQSNPDAVSINLGQLGLQPGVYIYTVRIKSAASSYSKTSGKIIVTK